MRKPRDFTEKERYARYRWYALSAPLFVVVGLALGLIGGRWDWSVAVAAGVWLLALLSNASLAFDDRRRRLAGGRGLWLEDQPGDVLAERDELRRRLDIALAQLETVPTTSAGLKVLIPFHLRRIDNAVSVIKNGELPDPTRQHPTLIGPGDPR